MKNKGQILVSEGQRTNLSV